MTGLGSGIRMEACALPFSSRDPRHRGRNALGCERSLTKVSERSLTCQGRVALAETRERILDATAGIMREQGLARATTKEIARAAGLSEAALYRHFRSKEEIFLRLMRERLPRFIGALKGLPSRAGRDPLADTPVPDSLAALPFHSETFP